MTLHLSPGGRVRCEAVIALPMSARRAWGQIRDFHRYAAHDHFHAGFTIAGNVPRAGADLTIEHRYGPFGLQRVGRILRWREGDGWAFSDLSRRGRRVGFPHVLSMRLADTADGCELAIRVTGQWTAPTPRWVARLWLWWVMNAIVQTTRNQLLAFCQAAIHFGVVRPATATSNSAGASAIRRRCGSSRSRRG
jgi:hypothetical protein